MAKRWRNKIRGHEKRDPEKILLNTNNPRRHPAFQWTALEFSIDKVGFMREVIINTREKSKGWKKAERIETLVDGELRCKLATNEMVKEVEVTLVDLTPNEEKTALLIFDRVAEMAHTDRMKALDVIGDLGELEQEAKEMLSALRYIPPEDVEDPDKWVIDYHVVVHCPSETSQVRVIEQLAERGYPCRALIS